MSISYYDNNITVEAECQLTAMLQYEYIWGDATPTFNMSVDIVLAYLCVHCGHCIGISMCPQWTLYWHICVSILLAYLCVHCGHCIGISVCPVWTLYWHICVSTVDIVLAYLCVHCGHCIAISADNALHNVSHWHFSSQCHSWCLWLTFLQPMPLPMSLIDISPDKGLADVSDWQFVSPS